MKTKRPTHLRIIKWETKQLPKNSDGVYFIEITDTKSKEIYYDTAVFVPETLMSPVTNKKINFDRWRGLNFTTDLFVKKDKDCNFKVTAWGQLKRDWIK